MNMFQKASKMKLRFESAKGLLTVEDLWDLPLLNKVPCLNDIAKGLSKKLKEAETENFVEQTTTTDDTAQLSFDIVREVIKVRVEEKTARENSAKLASEKRRIMEIIATKENKELEDKDISELKELLAGMQ